ncbi:pyocin knob domain-containing protein [Celeribacter naphthalenivorans]|uniref:pyocin knob domain-containing protein n=1 Tax=Celeribacter naphthalenivorans TaxID=1614694 RepID=UPI001CFB1AD1|nr:pyocin knob domain-containing protein [Celeribacter naphthalenivorans]
MPRNGSGVYTLPVGYEAVTDETATAAQHNTPLEDLASDANAARPIVAGGTGASSESAARANLGLAIGTNVQAYNANLASLSGLTLEAGKMLYATAADTLALTDLSDHVRTNILPAADGDELWDAIGLGLVAQSAKSDLTDADDIDIGGFYILTAGATNAPSANDCSATVAREDADNIIVTATDAVTGDVYTRSKVAGVWGDWGRMARADEVPGLGQRWEDASSEYSSGIAYQNTEPREIEFVVQIDTNAGSGNTDIRASHDGVTWVSLANISGNNGKSISFSVPPLGYFSSSNAGAVLGWKVKRTV